MLSYEAMIDGLLDGGICEFLDMIQDGIIRANVQSQGRMTSEESLLLLTGFLVNGDREVSVEIRERVINSTNQTSVWYSIHHPNPSENHRYIGMFDDFVYEAEMVEDFLSILITDENEGPRVSMTWTAGVLTTLRRIKKT